MEIPSYKFLILERRRNVMIITLNRPEKKNAMHIDLRLELMDCLRFLSEYKKISAVIIYGGPTVFCAGFDKEEIIGINTPEKLQTFNRHNKMFHLAFLQFPKLLIAAINGYALAGGFDLSMLCHMRVASKSAIFGHPEIAFGATPLFCLYQEVVGKGKALELTLNTANKERFLSADEAYIIGIINKVSSSPDALNDALEIAKSITESPSYAITNVLHVSMIMTNTIQTIAKEFDAITEGTEKYIRSLQSPSS
jgi:enoyl-CoA hydratase/carnithine racemase